MNTRNVLRLTVFLNLLLCGLLVLTPRSPLFSLQAVDEGEVRVWLRSASTTVKLETGETAEFEVEMSEVERSVCPGVQSRAFSILCAHLPSLQLCATCYLVFALLLLASTSASVLNIFSLLRHSKPFSQTLKLAHYVTAPAAFGLTLTVFLLTMSGDWQTDLVIKHESGAVYGLVFIAIVGISATSAYAYLSASGALLTVDSSGSLLAQSPTTSDNSNLSLLRNQLEHYKNQLQEAEVTNQRYHLLQVQFSDLQSQLEEAKILELRKQVEVLESGLPADVQTALKAKSREIAELSKELIDLRGKLVEQVTTDESYLLLNKRSQQARSPVDAVEISDIIEDEPRSVVERHRQSEVRTRPTTGLTESLKQSIPEDQSGVSRSRGEIETLRKAVSELVDEIAAKDRDTQRLRQSLIAREEELSRAQHLLESSQRQLRENAITFQEALKNKQTEIEFLQGKGDAQGTQLLALENKLSELVYEREKLKVALSSEKSFTSELETRAKSLSEESLRLQSLLSRSESQLETALTANRIMAEQLTKAEGDVELLRKEHKILQEKHEKTLEEITASSGEQTETMRRVYKEMHDKEVRELKEFYEERMKKMESDIAAAKEENSSDDSQHWKEVESVRSQLATAKEQEAAIALQLQSALSSLANSEAQLLSRSDEISSLTSTVKRLTEEVKFLSATLETTQAKLNAALISQSETLISSQRTNSDSSRVSESSEIRAFFEQKILRMRSELITERQERAAETEAREKLAEEMSAIRGEKERLQDSVELLKREIAKAQSDVEGLQQRWTEERSELHAEITSLCAENRQLHSSAADLLSLKSTISAQSAEIQRKAEIIGNLQVEVIGLQSKSLAPDRLKQDVGDLRALVAVKERVLQELTAALAAKAGENKSLMERIGELETALETAEKSDSEARARRAAVERDLQLTLQDYERVKERLKVSEVELERRKQEWERVSGSLSERYQQDSDALKRIYEEHFQSDLKDIKSLYESRITSLTNDLEELRKENYDLAGSNARLSGAKQRLDRMAKQSAEELEEAQQRVQELTVKLNTVTGQYHDQINLNMSLETALNSLKTTRGKATEDLISSLLGQNSALTQELSDKARLLDSVTQEKAAIKAELDQVSSELESCKSEVLSLHKEVYDSKRTLFRHSLTVSSVVSKEETESVSSTYPEGEQALKLIYLPDLTENNAILRTVSGAKPEAPMTNTNVWKTIETLLSEKAKIDKGDAAIGREPKPLDEVTVALFHAKYKVKSLAIRQLQALLGGLRELEGLNHAYGTLFCRMLKVSLSKPLPDALVNFLVSTQEELIDEGQQALGEFGPLSTISTVQKVIKKSFSHARESGERVASRLKLDSSDAITVLMLRVIGSAASFDSWQSLLDLRPGDSLQMGEFMDRLRDRCDVWVSEKEVTMLWTALRNPDSDSIGAEEIEVMEPPAQLRELMLSKEFLVSKCSFLTAVVEEFEYGVAQDYLRLSAVFAGLESHRSTLMARFKELDPRLPQDKCEEFADETMAESATKGESPVSLAAVVAIRHRVAGCGGADFSGTSYLGKRPRTLSLSPRPSGTQSRGSMLRE